MKRTVLLIIGLVLILWIFLLFNTYFKSTVNGKGPNTAVDHNKILCILVFGDWMDEGIHYRDGGMYTMKEGACVRRVFFDKRTIP